MSAPSDFGGNNWPRYPPGFMSVPPLDLNSSPIVGHGEFLSGGGGRKLKLDEVVVATKCSKDKSKEKVAEGTPKRKAGRPKGSKNRPKAGAIQAREGDEVLNNSAVSGNIREQLKALGNSKDSFLMKDLTRDKGVVTCDYSGKCVRVLRADNNPVRAEKMNETVLGGCSAGNNSRAKRLRGSSENNVNESRCFACMVEKIRNDRAVTEISSMCGCDRTFERIKGKAQSAAAFVCKLLEESPLEARRQGILGVVALLATTHSIEISRTLARYLGEDLMSAVVCKNYAAAFDLDTVARKAGQTITGARELLCLDDIRLNIKSPSTIGSQNLLNLEPPSLPEGGEPQGFLGYAVNLLRLKHGYLKWKTCSGHGLRETLFYRLFGGLQVYQNIECIMMARAWIKDGAVSLDGGVIANGLVSTGRREPDIIFPVKTRAEELLEERSLETIDNRR